MKTYQREIKTIIYRETFQSDRFILGTYIALVAQWIEHLFPRSKSMITFTFSSRILILLTGIAMYLETFIHTHD